MLAKDLEERVARRSRQAIGLVGVAALGLGIWGFTTRVVGEHVTDCGFEGQGRVYAKVRVNNLLGGVHDQTVRVDFNFRDEYYDSGVATAHVAAHGHGTTVVRERFPPYGPFTDPTPEGLHCSIVDVESDHDSTRPVSRRAFPPDGPTYRDFEPVPNGAV